MQPWRYTLKLHIGLIFLLVVLASCVTIAGISLARSSQMLTRATDDLFSRISKETVTDIQTAFLPGENAVALMAQHPVTDAASLDKRLDSLPIFKQALGLSPNQASLFVGYDNGDFFMFRRLPDSPEARATLRAPDGAKFAVQSIEHPASGPAIGTFLYYDADLGEMKRDDRPDYVTFDPRKRPWYEKASVSLFQIKTQPYVFFSFSEIGTTLAWTAANSRAVIGADIIHEVRTRFEVLWRVAEIAFWKEISEGGDRPALEAALKAEQDRLADDFAFVAICNEGGEFMSDDKVTRPANQIIPDNNRWGFRMSVPQYLYNRGELYNLTVRRGTLTEEDRYKINEHIVQTMIMLSELPFSKHLREVPEIAGSHHEKMDGTGYPRRLQGQEINLLGRIMVVADIFEALTAVDRPYKKGKTLSEAVKIMSFMVKDHHLDRELFELFLTSGAYRLYAEKFMRPEQIDMVDIAAYITQQAKIA